MILNGLIGHGPTMLNAANMPKYAGIGANQ
jgi:hypothetical protein